MKKTPIKGLIGLFVVVGFALNLSACGKTADSTAAFRNTLASESTTAQQIPGKKVSETTANEALSKQNPVSLDRYHALGAASKAVYKTMQTAFDTQAVTIPETEAQFHSEVFDRTLFYAFLADHPEYFHVRGNSTMYAYTNSAKKVYRFDIHYFYSTDEYTRRLKRINAIFRSICATMDENAEDIDKARAVYDYLIDHCEYDTSYTGNSLRETETTASYMDGALIEGKAVCSGYSRAFKWMMDRFGIPCTCIANTEHEWNIVYLNGQFYHIDVTWADDGGSDRYKFFCVSDQTIYQTHQKPHRFFPACETDL